MISLVLIYKDGACGIGTIQGIIILAFSLVNTSLANKDLYFKTYQYTLIEQQVAMQIGKWFEVQCSQLL